MSKVESKSRFITPLAILSYPFLATAQKAQRADAKDKFSASFVITPDVLADPKEKELFQKIQQAMLEKVKAKFGDRAEQLLKSDGFKKGIRRDAESKGYPEGSVYFSARSEQQPGLVYAYPDPATGKPAKVAQDDIKKVFYAGALVRGLVSVFTFDRSDSKGVTFGLEGIQFVRDGERIDGRVKAEDAFDADLSAAPMSLDDLIS